MTGRRIAVMFLLVAGLTVLVYFQFRSWQEFDWSQLWRQTRRVNPLLLLAAVACIYTTYYLRALRWKIFLKPVKDVPAARLTAPTIIGFTGLALLGRPGEFVRPYLIARKEGLSVTTQVGVWTVERIFDLGAFTILFAIDILVSRELRQLRYFSVIESAGKFLGLLTIGLAVFTFLVWRWGEPVASTISGALGKISRSMAHQVENKLSLFSRGLHTLQGLRSLLQVLGLSLALWLVIALAYWSVVSSYSSTSAPLPAPESSTHPRVMPYEMHLAHVFPLIASSMAGSVVQLPAVGGGAQLAVIKVLHAAYQVPPETAVSCGMLLWLVGFMAVIPTGLVLTRREHVSLRKLSQQSEEAEARIEAGSPETPQTEPGPVAASETRSP